MRGEPVDSNSAAALTRTNAALDFGTPTSCQLAEGIIRKLQRNEIGRLRAHLLRLSDEDRRLRFCGPAKDAAIDRYLARRSDHRFITLGFFCDGELRAAAEMAFRSPRQTMRGAAEVALSVEHALQGRGIGTELLRRMCVIARNRGVTSVVMVCLPENRKLLAVARKLAATLTVEHSSTIEGKLILPWPDYLSLADEALADGFALLSLMLGEGDARRRA